MEHLGVPIHEYKQQAEEDSDSDNSEDSAGEPEFDFLP